MHWTIHLRSICKTKDCGALPDRLGSAPHFQMKSSTHGGRAIFPIPPLLQNPKVLVGYDVEVVAESLPFLRDGFPHEFKDVVGELLLTWVVAVVGHVLVQKSPKPLNWIEMGAVGRAAGSDGYGALPWRGRL